MSTRLDQFIKDHREDFDDEMPSPKVWDAIEDKVMPEKKISTTPVVKINFMRWSAAAAAVVLVTLAAWMMLRTKTTKEEIKKETGIAKTQPVQQKQNTPTIDSNKTVVPDSNPTQQQLAQNNNPVTTQKQNDDATTQQSSVNEELYHFAKIVEIKHRELKVMAKDE